MESGGTQPPNRVHKSHRYTFFKGHSAHALGALYAPKCTPVQRRGTGDVMVRGTEPPKNQGQRKGTMGALCTCSGVFSHPKLHSCPQEGERDEGVHRTPTPEGECKEIGKEEGRAFPIENSAPAQECSPQPKKHPKRQGGGQGELSPHPKLSTEGGRGGRGWGAQSLPGRRERGRHGELSPWGALHTLRGALHSPQKWRRRVGGSEPP